MRVERKMEENFVEKREIEKKAESQPFFSLLIINGMCHVLDVLIIIMLLMMNVSISLDDS